MSKDSDIDSTSATPARKKRRWLRWILTPLVLVGGVAAFAPTIVCMPAVRDAVLQRAVPASAGQVKLDGLSVGWFAPAELRGLRYERGSILVEAESVKCDRTLIDLAKDWKNLGRIEIVAPNIVVDPSKETAATEAGSGTTAPESPPATSSAMPLVNAEITITNGTLAVLNAAGKPRWTVRDVECKVLAPVGCDAATIDARAVAGDGRRAMAIAATGKIKWPIQSMSHDLVDAQLDCKEVDLEIINEMLAGRAGGDDFEHAAADSRATFAGIAAVRVRVQPGDAGELVLRADAGVKNFAFIDPNDDFELREPKVILTAAATLGRDALKIESVQLEAAGMTLDATAQTRWPIQSIATDLVEGQISFAGIPLKLANPFLDGDGGAGTGMELGGVASGSAAVRPAADGTIEAAAKIDVANFAFVDRANKLEIREPKLAIRAGGVADERTVQVQTIQIVAGKRTIEAAGSSIWPIKSLAGDLESAHLKFTGIDLAMANAFLKPSDPGGGTPKRLELVGVAQGSADLRPAQGGVIAAQANVAVANFAFVDEAHHFEYREPKVTITATGSLAPKSAIIDSIKLRAGATALDAAAETRWPIKEITSDLVEANIQFAGIDLRLANAFLASPAATPAGNSRPAARSPAAQPAPTNRASNITMDSGRAARRTDRMPQSDPPAPASTGGGTELAGVASGTITVQPQAGGAISAETRIDVQDFSMFLPSSQFEFRDPQISLTATAMKKGDAVEVQSLRVQSASVDLDGAGRITDLSTAMNADVGGQFACDWKSLQAHMSEVLPKGMSLAGRARRPWSLVGPLKGREGDEIVQLVKADIATHFEFPEFFGMELAPVEFAAKLDGGVLHVEPIQTTLQRGKVDIEPTVRFEKAGPVATLRAGTLLDHVQIDKAMCDAALRYVNPLIAGKGDLAGEVSLDVERFKMPLGEGGLKQADIVGELALDNAEFHPDGVLVQILNVAGLRVPQTMNVSQTIGVKMQDGRIHHTGLKLPLGGDDYIVLDGWVGLDHTLSIVVDTPISSKLAAGNSGAGRLLKGQRIQIPVTGTIERMRFDQSAVAANLKKMIQTGIADKLNDAIGDKIGESLKGDDLLNGILKKGQKK